MLQEHRYHSRLRHPRFNPLLFVETSKTIAARELTLPKESAWIDNSSYYLLWLQSHWLLGNAVVPEMGLKSSPFRQTENLPRQAQNAYHNKPHG